MISTPNMPSSERASERPSSPSTLRRTIARDRDADADAGADADDDADADADAAPDACVEPIMISSTVSSGEVNDAGNGCHTLVVASRTSVTGTQVGQSLLHLHLLRPLQLPQPDPSHFHVTCSVWPGKG